MANQGWHSGNVFIRPNKLEKAGDKTEGHKHNFDHTTIIFSGAVHVRAVLEDGRVIERDFGEGTELGLRHFLVLANSEHEITALVDNIEYWCVYSHRTPQGEVTQVYTGWEDAYQ